ncbi:type II secretion system protein G (GspG) [Neorhodopirellula lusitana]|uniref:Type II secretion system protein G (GspG) n=2 Tax=Neorhodopirellula lusitana TaxID=445327 RepID=A0ABY1Q965_9BACT|nr:type II secretion system protein G (GspG) [Neorhodopirellula lusitana]
MPIRTMPIPSISSTPVNSSAPSATCMPRSTESTQRLRRRARRMTQGQNTSASSRRGFTLLELMLVLSILVVIGGIVVVNVSGAKSDADIKATQTQLNSLKSNIVYYKLKMNELPESLDNLRDGPSDSSKKAKWVDSIIESIPTDAWGNSFDMSVKGNEFEIKSAGLDGQMNTEDDLTVTGR